MVKRGKGGKQALAYCQVLLNDPCVYCGQMGSDSIDHIVPYSKKDLEGPEFVVNHWSNFSPCHRACNRRKGSKGVLWNLIGLYQQHGTAPSQYIQ